MSTPIVTTGCGRRGGAFARASRGTHRVLAYDPAAERLEGVEPGGTGAVDAAIRRAGEPAAEAAR